MISLYCFALAVGGLPSKPQQTVMTAGTNLETRFPTAGYFLKTDVPPESSDRS